MQQTTKPNRSVKRSAFLGMLVAAVLCGFTGCKSSPHNDVYIDKLTAEIRFLEDQLYSIDYENKVLREKLTRTARSNSGSPPERKSLFGIGDRKSPEGRRDFRSDGLGDSELIETPAASLGEPRIDIPEFNVPDTERGPIAPPSDDELQLPEIDLGIPDPPSVLSEPRLPPGQIALPASVNQLYVKPDGPAERLEIELAFTENIDTDRDQSSDGIKIAVRAFDARNNTVAINAGLQVAILDPELKGSEARLGRWSFSAEEVAEAQRSINGISMHLLTIRWNERIPTGKSVMAFCRTDEAIDSRLQTDAIVELEKSSVAEVWSPRGINAPIVR